MAERMLTPPQAAKLLGVNADKVRAWIMRGELGAIDVSDQPGRGRPRYRIEPADLAAFKAKRAAIGAPAPRKRKQRRPDVIQFV